MANVVIVIQARSNSTRFPKKIYELLGDKMVLQHVVDQALSSKLYVERSVQKKIDCSVVVAHPEDDEQVKTTFKKCGAFLLGGSEKDVLSRYIKAQEQFRADYVVRLTSDCPLVLDFVISKHIHSAVYNDFDYISNVEEDIRLVFDGMDVEIMSKKAIEWLKDNATSAFDKEHVTTALRRERPKSLRFGFVSSKLDTSGMKLSLDTPEDLENIRSYYHSRESKIKAAERRYGIRGIFNI